MKSYQKAFAYALFLCFSLFVYSCEGSLNDDHSLEEQPNSNTIIRNFDFDSFESSENLIGSPFGLDQHFAYPVNFAVEGNYAYILDDRSKSPIHIIKLDTKEYFKSFSSLGAGPGELLAPFSVQVVNDRLWVYDVQLSRFSNVKTSDILDSATTHFEKSIKIENSLSCISPLWINDETFVSVNIEANQRGRLNFFGKSGKVEINTGSLNLSKPSEDPISMLLQAYQGALSLDLNREKIIVSNLWTDRIEVFKNDGSTDFVIVGPEEELPAYQILNGPESSLILGITEEAKVYYTQARATERYIYALYSGKPPGEEGDNQIFVFDKNTGQPIRRLALDKDITNFYVSENDDFFYALTIGDNADISEYKL